MTLLAIDPGRSYKGEATIGVVLFALRQDSRYHELGAEIQRKRVTWEELCDSLEVETEYGEQILYFDGYEVNEVVIEDFVNDPKSARGGQRNGTSECIGSVEIMARKAEVPVTRQEPAALGPAKMHAPEGSWKKLKHLRHEDSAFLHGYEYLVRKGVLQSAGLAETMSTAHTDRSTT